MHELSDTKIRNAKPADKEYTLADGQGLSVWVRHNGTKLWLYRYRFGGKRKNMSFGIFPGVGLRAAREKRHDAEKLLDQGQDPAAVREAKRKDDEKQKHTFRAVGQEWLTKKLEKENKAKATIKRERWNLRQLNREIGDRPLCEIEPPELLTAMRRVEARGRYYTVGRLRSTASRVFQYGIGAVVLHQRSHPRLEARAYQGAQGQSAPGADRPGRRRRADAADRSLRRQERRASALRAQADRLDHGAAGRITASGVDRIRRGEPDMADPRREDEDAR